MKNSTIIHYVTKYTLILIGVFFLFGFCNTLFNAKDTFANIAGVVLGVSGGLCLALTIRSDVNKVTVEK